MSKSNPVEFPPIPRAKAAENCGEFSNRATTNDDLDELISSLKGLNHLVSHRLCPFRFHPDQSGSTKRQREFQAGRHCAETQLRALGETKKVATNQDRSPAWPAGFVGSISHSDRWVWAAVARDQHFQSIGIDTEVIANRETIEQVQTDIAGPDEWKLLETTGLSPSEIFSLVFSAKEAFYKCWYPTNPQYFDFSDAKVEAACEQRLKICSMPSNPNYQTSPPSLDVHFFVRKNSVFTITWLEAQ